MWGENTDRQQIYEWGRFCVEVEVVNGKEERMGRRKINGEPKEGWRLRGSQGDVRKGRGWG